MKSRTEAPDPGLAREALELLDDSARSIGAHERVRLRGIVACDRLGLWEDQGARSYAQWLSARHGMSNWRARREIEAAYALEELPRTAAALSAGALHIDKVLELARFATPATEKKLISWARRVSPAAIRRRGDEKEEAKLDEATDAHAARYVKTWYSADGTGLVIDGFLPAAAGAAFRKELDRLAYSLPEAPPGEDGTKQDEATSIEQRRADALCLMASAHIAKDQNPDLATVVLNVPLEALEEGTYGAHIEGGPQLHPETARRLLCDCRLQPLATGKNGDIGIGRASQNVPRWLRRLVMKKANDTCTFPGCEQKAFLHPHHVAHWTRDEGPTQAVNLTMLCTYHHTLVHEGGWSVILDAAAGPIFFRPSGRRYEPGVPDVDEAMRAEIDRELENDPIATMLEERFGIQNFKYKEFSSDAANDLYELARNLASV